MTKTRECENWLDTFLEWTKPVSESPESLLTWSGLFCLSSVLKRKVRFSKEYTKRYDILPTTFVIFVGPPGVVRKSTSAGYAQELLDAVNLLCPKGNPARVYFGPTSGSHQAIIEKMAGEIEGTLSIIAGEFGNIVSTAPEKMYDFLAHMFDSDGAAQRYEHSTRQFKNEVIKFPTLNLLGCTTPDWMLQNSGYMLGGGFAARTVFIFEDKARQKQLFYKDIGPSVKELIGLKAKLVKDLLHIGGLKGEAKPINKKLADRMEKWYQDYSDEPAERGTETFQSRKHIHTLRTAMVLSICERSDLIITEEHFDKALKLIDEVERNLGHGLAMVGKNPQSKALHLIEKYVRQHEPVLKGEVVSYFMLDLSVDDIYKVLEVLRISGKVVEVDSGGHNPPMLEMREKK